MSFLSYKTREVLEELERMLDERVKLGNCQSKHGDDAAFSYEAIRLAQALDKLMSKQETEAK
jgi:hypothetical protein